MNEHQDLDARLRGAIGDHTPDLGDDVVSGAPRRRAPRIVTQRQRAGIAGGALTLAAAAVVTAVALPSALSTPSGPLFTLAGGSGAEAATLAGAEDSRMMIAPWVLYEYLAGGGLSTSGGSGAVYQLRRSGDPEELAARLAGVFGVEGEVHRAQWSDDDYPLYAVGDDVNGLEPVVNVDGFGSGSWYYNNPASYAETSGASKAPGEAEARRLAAELFPQLGATVSAEDIVVTADEWATTATAGLRVDGIATSLEWAISWTPTGEIGWASGFSVEVVDRGDFGTVSAHAAVERIADGGWWGSPGPDYTSGVWLAAASGLARDASVMTAVEEVAEPSAEPTTEPAEPTTPTEPTTAPVDPSTEPIDPSAEPTPTEPGGEPTVEPLPVDEGEIPEPELVTATLETSESTLLLVWDADGNVWLVPGYVYPHPDGGWISVISLVEGVIELG